MEDDNGEPIMVKSQGMKKQNDKHRNKTQKWSQGYGEESYKKMAMDYSHMTIIEGYEEFQNRDHWNKTHTMTSNTGWAT